MLWEAVHKENYCLTQNINVVEYDFLKFQFDTSVSLQLSQKIAALICCVTGRPDKLLCSEPSYDHTKIWQDDQWEMLEWSHNRVFK